MSWRTKPCSTATLVRRLAQQTNFWRAMSSSKGASDATAAPVAAGGSGGTGSGSGSYKVGAKRQRLLAPLPASKGGNKPKAKGAATASYREPGPGRIELPGGTELTYRTDALPAAEAAALFATLRREMPWEQRSVRIMGRALPQPRLVAYQADGPELSYTYSGATLAPAPWHPSVRTLKALAEAAAGTRFNACLLNLYRSGSDSIAWHSDNERLFGERPVIASVSLGAPREFLLRCNADHSVRYRFRLGGGALLVMGPGVQQGWMHSVPRRAGMAGERISLTFRTVVAPERGATDGGGGSIDGGVGG
ncbi:hypothetical protein ABPG75_001434 [Micractinium tetrahymenae]